MSISFDKSTFESMGFIPENLRSQEIYPKLTGMTDYIVRRFAEDFEDIKYKYRGTDLVRDEVIKEIINDLGFEYITSVMDTITNFEFDTLLDFVSLINLLKGSRLGLELVLRLLGFESIIKEWWEQDPPHAPYTFEIVVVMDLSFVPDVFETLERVQVFARAYVYPIIENIDFRFSLSFGELNVIFAGFFKPRYSTLIPILGRIP